MVSIQDTISKYMHVNGRVYLQHITNYQEARRDKKVVPGSLFELVLSNAPFKGQKCTLLKFENLTHILRNEDKQGALKQKLDLVSKTLTDTFSNLSNYRKIVSKLASED